MTDPTPGTCHSTLYVAFGTLSVGQTAVLSCAATINAPSPTWAIGAGAVLGVIGGAFGFVAAGNTAVTVEHDENLDLDVDDVI